MKQRTLKTKAVFEGLGLHTGRKVTVCVGPALENSGILFCRVDLAPGLRVKASIENVCSDEMRQTAIMAGKGRVRTIEHLMAAFHGLGIDNALVEIDGEEVPGLYRPGRSVDRDLARRFILDLLYAQLSG